MEYLDGETLAQRLDTGALPLDQALQIAIQIADALDKAHRQGIVHRDVKPGNILLTKAGPKLLDFGLAKLKPVGGEVGVSGMPTQSAGLTGKGTILGTLQYMAPEQLEGKEADARTDIFAFGTVVYEMVTGRKAFEGQSQASLIAAILEHEPPVMSSIQSLAPPILDHIVTTALAKDPDRRWVSAGDVCRQLLWVVDRGFQVDLPKGAPAKNSTRDRRLALAGWIAAALMTGVAIWSLVRVQPSPSPVRLTLAVPAPYALVDEGVALSPDGRDLVYVGIQQGGSLSATTGSIQTQLFRRRLGEFEAMPIPGTDGGLRPFLSPDGQWVGFFARDGLTKVHLEDGSRVALCAVPGFGQSGRWYADGTIVFTVFAGAGGSPHGVLRVSDQGGVPEPLTTPDLDAGEIVHAHAELVSGTDALLFERWRGRPVPDNAEIMVQSLTTGDQRVLAKGFAPRVTSSGHLLFARADGLWAAPLDATAMALTAEPRAVVTGVGSSDTGFASYALSDDGMLVYIPTESATLNRGVLGATATGTHTRLVWVNRAGEEVGLDAPTRAYYYPRISPDGTQISLDIRDQDQDAWVWDLTRRTLTRLSDDEALDQYALWTPDGARIVFMSTRDGRYNVYWKAADGSGHAERLLESESSHFPQSISPDGRHLVVREQVGPRSDLITISLSGDPSRAVLLASEYDELNAEISPDGRWLAYESDRSGDHEIYVSPFPDVGASRVKISTDGGTTPAWSRDGAELFYRSGDRLMVVQVNTGATFTSGTATTLFSGDFHVGVGRTFDVAPDGERFLMIKPREPEAGHINVVTNWFEELTQRVPID